jgi:hypothetical protein
MVTEEIQQVTITIPFNREDTEANFNIYRVVWEVCESLTTCLTHKEVYAWPDDLLPQGVTALTMAHHALELWKRGEFDQSIAVAEMARLVIKEFPPSL